MQTTFAINAETGSEVGRRDLLLLLVTSAACVLTLALGAGDATADAGAAATMRSVTLVLLLALGAGVGFMFLSRVRDGARRRIGEVEGELADLRRRLIAAEAVVNAEPQVLIFWEQGWGLRIVAHTLASVPGLPADEAELVKFGGWLEATAANDLKTALDALFQSGRAFTLLLKTIAGGHLEADGRAVGGCAVLRLRDIAGHKLDLMRIIEQHRQLSHEIKAGRAALEALPAPVWIRAVDGSLEWVNAAYVKAVEASDREEVTARGIELLATRELAGIAAAIGEGRRTTGRYQLVIGGERRPHDVIVEPIEGASVGIALDMTAADAAKGRLDRELKAFDATLDRVTSAVAIFGPDQRMIYCNTAYTELWRIERAWLGERRLEGEILDRLREQSKLPAAVSYRDWKKKWLSIYRGGSPVEDWWHLGDDRIIHVHGAPRPDGGVAYVFEDVTARLALESQYRTLINVQRETLDALREGVAVFATDGRLRLFNAGFASLWGLTSAELDGEPHIATVIEKASVLFEDPQTWDTLASLVTSLPEERAPLTGGMQRSDGTIVDFSAVPLPDGGTLISFTDVTTARKYERALIERNEALVSADRLKSQFISHVSYELRTPLTNIIGFGDLLALPRTGPLNERQRDYLGDISVSSRTLLAIIDDILDLATIDAGALELKLVSADVRQILEESVRSVSEFAMRGEVTVEVDVAEDVTELVADPARVRQVMSNLLSNAIAFSSARQTVRVTCRHTPGDRGGSGQAAREDMIVFTVADEGIGIPAEWQPHVFERFVGYNNGGRRRGAGLGLPIVKSLVELHGGEAAIESAPGRGTRVIVRLPVRPGTPMRTAERSIAAGAATPSRSEPLADETAAAQSRRRPRRRKA